MKHVLLATFAGLAMASAAPAALAAPDRAAPEAQAAPAQDSDPLFAQPYIDKDEWRSAPARHRYVHGGFKGTDLKFSIYFPANAAYQGRFFQYVTPVPDSETLSQGLQGEEDRIGFALSHGAYFIETNLGGEGATAGPAFRADPTIAGYRASAAVARYSRVLASAMYPATAQPYGYVYGGSGGAYRTIGSIENTSGVWDGAVPYVVPSPVASPNVFAVRMHAMRILWDKFPAIVDAIEPGGSGDPYDGLNTEQRQALAEVTRMGFPPKSWFGWKTMGVHAFVANYMGMRMADPGYFEDFWTKPGYLGFDPPASLAKARLQFPTQLTAVLTAEQLEAAGIASGRIAGTARGTADQAWKALGGAATGQPVAVRLGQTPPDVGFLGGDLLIRSGRAAGKTLSLRQLAGNTALFGVVDPRVLIDLRPGDEVTVDNSAFLAAQTYHRHQDPGPQYPVWDQFKDSFSRPIYPQRKVQLGPLFAQGAAGKLQTGRFTGKMIALSSLGDREAFPWNADWYRQRVQDNLGSETDARFRLWYVDHSLHGDQTKQESAGHTISYIGVLQQALLDLSAWVEKGTPPPATTSYAVENGQVMVPPTAEARMGIQPVVELTIAGAKRIDVKPGEPVSFNGSIVMPQGAGKVIEAQWDLDGSEAFTAKSPVPEGQTAVTVTMSRTFPQPGTYFVTLRGIGQRDGNRKTPFARIQNLDRVRVVVHDK